MRWLITGGCGFIGRNLIRRLARDPGAVFRIVDDLSTEARRTARSRRFCRARCRATQRCEWTDWTRSRVEFVAADIRDADALRNESAAGADVVVHLAANTGVAPSVEDPMHRLHDERSRHLELSRGVPAQRVRGLCWPRAARPSANCAPPIHEELASAPALALWRKQACGRGVLFRLCA